MPDSTKERFKHVFYESAGSDHEWQTWRRDERLRTSLVQD
jgi:hypothetical protein